MIKTGSTLASIVIANRNSEKFLNNCLNSIFLNSEKRIEVIVVDDNSTDRSIEIIKNNFANEKRLKLISLGSNVGPAEARNLGVKKSRGKYLVFLDSDVEVSKNFLRDTLNYLEKNPEIGAGQLKILRMDERNRFDCAGDKLTPLGFLSERARSSLDTGQFDKVEDIFSGKAAAMILRGDVFTKIGGFDGNYFIYWEEPDLLWRVWKSGFRVVFLPMGKVWHAYDTNLKRVSEEQASFLTYQGCKNHISTIVKNAVGRDLPRMFFWVTGSWLTLLVLFLLRFKIKRVKAITNSFIWLIKNRKLLIQKRKDTQKRLGKLYWLDRNWFGRITEKRGVYWYIGKGVSYVLGRPF